MNDDQLLAAARSGEAGAFAALVTPHRRGLLAHCYRMLGSVQDAEDALQEALLGAWRGLGTFEGRASLRGWLYQISTNACLRLIERRPRRLLSPDVAPARRDPAELGEIVDGPVWVEPWPDHEAADDPGAELLRRESVELAFVAALQHLPGTQRAVLVLREVLEFSAAEVAEMLNTSVPAVNSALQRARKVVEERAPGRTQEAELNALGAEGRRGLVAAFVAAWEGSDLTGLLRLLTDDARFSMPPLPAWFEGRDDVGRFFGERIFAASWRLVPLRINGQLGFACYTRASADQPFRLSAVNVLSVRDGRVARITGFLDPATHRVFELPEKISPPR